MSDTDSDDADGFDREAERRKLEEKYGDEDERRASTQRMSDLLLKGATMTNKHCDTCGDPLFRQNGQEFCPTCSAEGDGQTAQPQQTQAENPQSETSQSGQEAHGEQTRAEESQPEQPGRTQQTVEQPQQAQTAESQRAQEAAEQPQQARTERSRQPQQRSPEQSQQPRQSGQQPTRTGPPATPRESTRQPATRREQTEQPATRPERTEQPAPRRERTEQPATRQERPRDPATRRERTTQPATENSRARSRDAGEHAGAAWTDDVPASEVASDDLAAAQESLAEAVAYHARRGAEASDPRTANDHLAAAREAAEALSALRR